MGGGFCCFEGMLVVGDYWFVVILFFDFSVLWFDLDG